MMERAITSYALANSEEDVWSVEATSAKGSVRDMKNKN
jgi:hypothetical protein